MAKKRYDEEAEYYLYTPWRNYADAITSLTVSGGITLRVSTVFSTTLRIRSLGQQDENPSSPSSPMASIFMRRSFFISNLLIH